MKRFFDIIPPKQIEIEKFSFERRVFSLARILKRALIKITCFLLIIGLNWAGLSAIGETFAYFNDTETSSENSLDAGTLDFSPDYDEWEPAETAANLRPGDSVTRNVEISKEEEEGLDFLYNVSTNMTDGNIAFCNALQLTANLDEGDVEYSGSLMSLNYGPVAFIAPENWVFTVNLPSGGPGFEGLSCEFKFVFDGWQDNLPPIEGFSDHEELENLLEASPLMTSSLSPIADAYVNQSTPNVNYGDNGSLYIRSKNPANNRRSYVRFDFDFPAETNILSSELKLFMHLAPAESRIYEARRVGNDPPRTPWTESGITWNNQPTITSFTASTTSGITDDVWLSWNVTGDVQNFAAGTPNYGWQLRDSVEDSAANRRARFFSRENINADFRPVLEVNFEAPPATTIYLVINEVYYHVGIGRGVDPLNEWVEIYNPTDAPVNISGWKICDAGTCDVIPVSPLIPAKGFAVITKNASTWLNWPSIPSEAVKIVLGSNIGGGLAKSGDAVRLLNSFNVEIDSMSYGSDVSELNPSIPISGRGKSLARIIKGYDADLATDWIINAAPNPGTNPSTLRQAQGRLLREDSGQAPLENGVEIMRFTSEGVEVAGFEQGLAPLSIIEEGAEEEETIEEPVMENQESGGLNQESGIMNEESGIGSSDNDNDNVGNGSVNESSMDSLNNVSPISNSETTSSGVTSQEEAMTNNGTANEALPESNSPVGAETSGNEEIPPLNSQVPTDEAPGTTIEHSPTILPENDYSLPEPNSQTSNGGGGNGGNGGNGDGDLPMVDSIIPLS